MLLSSQTNRYALQLLEARNKGKPLPPLSSRGPLSVSDAYEVAKTVADIRIANGETMVGRKVGFANRKFHAQHHGEHHGLVGQPGTPSWSPLFDTTVRYVEDNHGVQSLAGALQPRIQPEVVFKLGATPDPHASIHGLTDCIEWMAHGLEIVTCPYPDWQFEVPDAIAAFGLHGALLIGEPKSLSQASRHHLVQVLADSGVSLSRSDGDEMTLCAAGFGSDVMGSPVYALKRLQRLLTSHPEFPPLAAGEIVCTGAWAEAYPVTPGQTWITAFSGVSLPGLSISFV